MNSKVALVTGGTRGIGRAIAHMLLQKDYKVLICGRQDVAVDKAVAELALEFGDKVKGKAADVRNHDDVGELFGFLDTNFDGLDVLVNNAGVGVFRPISELSVQEWKDVIETNLSGSFYCSREALHRFAKRGPTPGGGYIINISSLAGKNPFAGGAAYNASKFGLNGFSEAMMLDHRNDNVRVSYVMPGSVMTEFGGHSPGTGSDWKIWPEDIAAIVRSLVELPERTLVSRVEVRPSKPEKSPKR